MATVIFNEETREFSVIESTEVFADKPKWDANGMLVKGESRADKAKNRYAKAYQFGKKSKRNMIAGGAAGALLGAGVGAAAARARAKRQAIEAGLEPGSAEYNAFVKRATMKGAGIGTAAGAGLGVGAGFGASKLAKYKGSKGLEGIARKGDADYMKGQSKTVRDAVKKGNISLGQVRRNSGLKGVGGKTYEEGLSSGVVGNKEKTFEFRGKKYTRESAAKYMDSLGNDSNTKMALKKAAAKNQVRLGSDEELDLI